MKRIAALLLVFVLLVPTLALAAKSTKASAPTPGPLPTFDFTAEEWLERYKEVVPEDSPYYFEEFETDVFPPGPTLAGKTYHRHYFENDERNAIIWLLSESLDDKPFRVQVLSPLGFYHGAAENTSRESFNTFLEICTASIRSTSPFLSDSEVKDLLQSLGILTFEEIPWNNITTEAALGNLILACSFDSLDRVNLKIEAN